MKKIYLILPLILASLALAALPLIKANRLMRLSWNENPSEDAVAFYTVHLDGPVQTNVNIDAPPIELTNILRDLPNGEYSLTITATGFSAITSPPSAPLAIFWYGNTPGAPANLLVSFPVTNLAVTSPGSVTAAASRSFQGATPEVTRLDGAAARVRIGAGIATPEPARGSVKPPIPPIPTPATPWKNAP